MRIIVEVDTSRRELVEDYADTLRSVLELTPTQTLVFVEQEE